MTCPNCKDENTEKQKFCGNCGTLLKNLVATEDLNRYILDIIDKHFEDKEVVEVKVAEAVVNKISNWAKIFAYFVGIPFTILIFILGFLGYNSYSSITSKIENVTSTIDPILDTAKKRIVVTKLQLDTLESDIAKYRTLVNQVSQLTEEVDRISEKINISGVSLGRSKDIEQLLNKYQNFFKNIGYNLTSTVVHVKITPGTKTRFNVPAYYYRDTMVIASSFVGENNLILREYTHRVLMSLTGGFNSNPFYTALESGLADYFPSSFDNNLKLFTTNKYNLVSSSDKIYESRFTESRPVDYSNMYSIAQTWTITFWDMHQTLGQDIADKILLNSCKSLKDTRNASYSAVLGIILEQAEKLGRGTYREQIKQIFLKRGVKE